MDTKHQSYILRKLLKCVQMEAKNNAYCLTLYTYS